MYDSRTTLSSSNLHLLQKVAGEKKRFFCTHLIALQRQSNFDCKRGNKNHKPNNNNNTTTYRLEYTVMNATHFHLPANVHLLQKKRDPCDTLTYLMALQTTLVERVSKRKNKYQISTYITKSTYFRVTTYSCRLKEGGSSQQKWRLPTHLPDEATPVKVHTSQETNIC